MTAGKYNDGSPENRQRLTDRMHRAMVEAFEATKRVPLDTVEVRHAPLVLPHRDGAQTADRLQALLSDPMKSLHERALAAMGLSSRQTAPGRS